MEYIDNHYIILIYTLGSIGIAIFGSILYMLNGLIKRDTNNFQTYIPLRLLLPFAISIYGLSNAVIVTVLHLIINL